MDDDADIGSTEVVDPEIREILGMFDAPAFARRGQELEQALDRLHARLRVRRDEMLAMVRLRVRQWAAAVEGPDAWRDHFGAPLDELINAIATEPAAWGTQPASTRRRRAIARDLIDSVERFNRRWGKGLDELPLGTINGLIDHYNRYYVLEKECVLGSTRLAARHFRPRARLTPVGLLADHPLLPVPVPRT